MTLGFNSTSRIVKVEFLVINHSLAYNAILDCPTLNKLGVVVSTSHLVMKFLLEDGKVISAQGDQAITRRCNNTSLKIQDKKKA